MPIDLSTLSDEDLQIYEDLVKEREEQKRAMPGPPKPPLPEGLKKDSKATYRVDDPALQRLVNNPKAQARMNSRKPEPGAFTLQDAASLIPGPTWMRPLVGASVQKPADFGTAALLSAATPAVDTLKAGNRGLNILLGGAKGAGLHELGLRANAALSGQQQPGFSERSVGDYGWQALSTLLGGLSARATSPKPPNQYQLDLDAYNTFLSDKANLSTKKALLQKALAGHDTELLSAQQAMTDAETALNKHKDRLAGMSRKVQTGSIEELNSQLNDLNDYIDRLKSKEHAADAFLSKRPERVSRIREIEAEIEKQEARRNINPKVQSNRGWQAAIDAKVQKLKDEITSLSDPEANKKAIEDELLRSQAQRRRLVTEKNRMASGFSTPSIADENDAKLLGDLEKQFSEAQTRVREKKLNLKTMKEQLADLGVEESKLKEPKKPAEPSQIAKFIKGGLRHTIPAGLGAEFGTALHLTPFLGALGGAAVEKLLSTDAGKKLLDLLSYPQAKNLIPITVNENTRK